jgi:protoporphyrinogen oxidase
MTGIQHKRKIAIIGGGIMGLSLALELRKQGHEISIFEADPDFGGLAKSWQFKDVTWDKFYHVILMSDTHTRKFLKELNIENEIEWVETKTGFYFKGKLYSLSNIFDFITFPPIGMIGKLRLGLTIFAASRIRNWKRLEKMPVEKWLLRWSGRRTFKRIWLPLLKSKLGDQYHKTSAAFIWSTIQRMYAARKSGLKKEMFGYVHGGYHRIIRTCCKYLAEKGVTLNAGYALKNLKTNGHQKELTFLNDQTYIADEVVFTLPSPHLKTIWNDMPDAEKILHGDIQYMGVCCTSVLLDKPLSPYYVTNILEDNNPFTGIIEMTAMVKREEMKGHALVYLPKYALQDDDLFTIDKDALHSRYKNKLLEMYPHLREQDILAMQTARVPYVFALQTMGYSAKLPSHNSSEKGIYYVNSAMVINSTLNVNETLSISKSFCQQHV